MEKVNSEFSKLRQMSPMSAEATVVRTYIDTLLEVPWDKTTKINVDLAKAKKILDEDHYGLKEVKERILEYLAVQKRVKKMKAPVLCFVGPYYMLYILSYCVFNLFYTFFYSTINCNSITSKHLYN